MKRIVLLVALLGATSLACWSQEELERYRQTSAYIIPIHGEIEPSRMIFVRRGIQKAEVDGADFIIFDIDTFGGRVDSALQIATLIGSARSAVTIAFVPATAEGTGVSWSAGALISFACNQIYMAPGTSIGAAAPVFQTQAGMEMAPEKTISAVRTQMAALAEKNGYPKPVALAMVDLDIELIEIFVDDEMILTSTDELPDIEREAAKNETEIEKGKIVSRSGKLLSLTAGEMDKYGISSGTVLDIDDLLGDLGVGAKDAVHLAESFADRAAAFITGAFLTGILIVAGLVALYMEVTSPGFGVPGTVAITCFAVVFLGSALLGTVGSIELLMFLLGVILLIVEIFLIPGFGITGAGGILLMAVALVLSRQDFILPEFTWEWDLFRSNLLVIGLSIVASVVFFGIIIRLFPHLPLFNRLILEQPGSDAAGGKSVGRASVPGDGMDLAVGDDAEVSIGAGGTVVTTLRPVGKADINGAVHIVRSDGEFIEEGTEVKVLEIHGNKILVQRS